MMQVVGVQGGSKPKQPVALIDRGFYFVIAKCR
jgi:hypothetical protein